MSREILEKNLSAMNKWYPDFVDLIRNKHDIEDDTETVSYTHLTLPTTSRV